MKHIIVYNAAGTCYLTAAGELDFLTRDGHPAPLEFDTAEEASGYTTLTQDGGRAVPSVQEPIHG
jgi:hypothetical protein